jgi:uncharacterized membrane protein YhaH (DUF805 family)
MYWYLKVLRQYADFSGRARRKEYWMFFLFYSIFVFVAMLLDNVFGTTYDFFELNRLLGTKPVSGWIYMIFAWAMFLPLLAVSVRRLHDIGRSGWFYLVGYIPFAGLVIMLIWSCTDSQPGENKWGANPKE